MKKIPSAAETYFGQLLALKELKPRIELLSGLVGSPRDLLLFQWAQLMAMVLQFRPDLILELGRGCGNSTCCFVEAAHALARIPHEHQPSGTALAQPSSSVNRSGATRDCKVRSLCLSSTWRTTTVPKLRSALPPDWFAPLSALETDICQFDFAEALAPARRVVLFWDAHGFQVASTVLSQIMPLLAGKPHLVLMHDMCDARYLGEGSRFYRENVLWTGNDWDGPRVRLGHVESTVEQAIAAVDFSSRNRIELHSADHSFHTELAADQQRQLQASLGELFSLNGYWFYFSLNEGEPPFTFPRTRDEVPSRTVHEARAAWFPRTVARWRRSLGKRLRAGAKQHKKL
jgi:hypothetical protein